MRPALLFILAPFVAFACARGKKKDDGAARPLPEEAAPHDTPSLPPRAVLHTGWLGLEPLDARVAWLAFDKHVYRTEDGGEHWSERTPPVAVSLPVVGIEAASADVATFYVDEGLFLTADAGLHWRKVVEGRIVGRWWLDARRGWVASVDGKGDGVSRTTDGGATWTRASIGPPRMTELAGAWFASPDGTNVFAELAFIADPMAPPPPALFASSDGGATWTRRSTESLMDPWFRDALHGVALAPIFEPSELRITADGGKTWKPCAPLENPLSLGFAPDFGTTTPPAFGTVLVGKDDDDVAFSSDDGATWTVATPPTKGSRPIVFTHGADAWILDVDVAPGARTSTLGTLHHTRDGVHWTTVEAKHTGPRAWSVMNFRFVDAQTAWATVHGTEADASEDFGVVVTHDGGRTWTSIGKVQ